MCVCIYIYIYIVRHGAVQPVQAALVGMPQGLAKLRQCNMILVLL